MQYLAFIVDTKGIKPNLTKVQALAQHPTPTSALQLNRFMGGINFYCKFVAHFSQLTNPLHQLANQPHFD